MKKKYGIIIVLGLVWHLAFTYEGLAENVSPESPAYQKALAVAKTVDDLIRATRKHYTDMVVRKITNDGAGASITYKKEKGFVPLPADFISRVTFEVAHQQAAEKQWRYDVKLISKWNINKNKGLILEYAKRGWDFLDKQQVQHRNAGKSLGQLIWEPYVEVDRYRDKMVLHYLSADPASDTACVTCHNTWEQKADIQRRRRKQGAELGKVFKYGELMGALSITVPIE